jgi:glycosyltransferase involved in cell wall biosynthesis
MPMYWEIVRKFIYRLAQNVVVQTNTVERWFKSNITTKNITVIPNAVRYSSRFHDSVAVSEKNAPFLVAIGRLGREKGFDLLIQAFSDSALAVGGYKLVILGEGQERSALEGQIGALGLVDSVSLPGHVGNVAQWLSKAQIFVLSSRYEGFPNALLEAMQLGVPSISFDCPSGPSDIIRNEHNGLLVPPENIEALSAALVRLASDRDLQKKFSTAARSINDQFSPQKIYRQWIEVIDRAYQDRERARGQKCRDGRRGQG